MSIIKKVIDTKEDLHISKNIAMKMTTSNFILDQPSYTFYICKIKYYMCMEHIIVNQMGCQDYI